MSITPVRPPWIDADGSIDAAKLTTVDDRVDALCYSLAIIERGPDQLMIVATLLSRLAILGGLQKDAFVRNVGVTYDLNRTDQSWRRNLDS